MQGQIALPRPVCQQRDVSPWDAISFGIISDGRRPAALCALVDSIRGQEVPRCEILRVGDGDVPVGVRTIAAQAEAHGGRLGALRNRAVEAAMHETVVLCDDDMRLHPEFVAGLRAYGPDFDALAVKVENPDGSRFWDYATIGGPRGHRLLPYDTPDDHTYITGGCIVARRSVLAAVRWSDRRGYYEQEDVDFSRRLRTAGFRIGFCLAARVTHCDWRYYQRFNTVARMPDWLAALRQRWAAR
jgi:GT2 family glycosyltransferase